MQLVSVQALDVKVPSMVSQPLHSSDPAVI